MIESPVPYHTISLSAEDSEQSYWPRDTLSKFSLRTLRAEKDGPAAALIVDAILHKAEDLRGIRKSLSHIGGDSFDCVAYAVHSLSSIDAPLPYVGATERGLLDRPGESLRQWSEAGGTFPARVVLVVADPSFVSVKEIESLLIDHVMDGAKLVAKRNPAARAKPSKKINRVRSRAVEARTGSAEILTSSLDAHLHALDVLSRSSAFLPGLAPEDHERLRGDGARRALRAAAARGAGDPPPSPVDGGDGPGAPRKPAGRRLAQIRDRAAASPILNGGSASSAARRRPTEAAVSAERSRLASFTLLAGIDGEAGDLLLRILDGEPFQGPCGEAFAAAVGMDAAAARSAVQTAAYLDDQRGAFVSKAPAKRGRKKSEILTVAGEDDLAAAWTSHGDLSARNRLIEAYRPMVLKLAKAAAVKSGLEIEDIAQEAFAALLHAAANYDPSLGNRFGTFARHHVGGAIHRHVLDFFAPFRLGTNIADKKVFFRFRKLRSEIEARTRKDLDDAGREEIAGKIGVPIETVLRMEPHLTCARSLFENVASEDGEDGLTLLESIPDEGESPEDSAVRLDTLRSAKTALAELLADLDSRSRLVLARRFFGEKKCLFETIGAEIGITKERVRQIERAALKTLRSALEGFGLTRESLIGA